MESAYRDLLGELMEMPKSSGQWWRVIAVTGEYLTVESVETGEREKVRYESRKTVH